MGRGLGIFPARPKTPFVPGEATTRDKRPPPYISFLLRPSPNTWFLICARPAPPTARAEHRRHRRLAAAQSRPRPHAPPPRATAAAVTPSPPSPARRRPAATGHPSPRRVPKGRARSRPLQHRALITESPCLHCLLLSNVGALMLGHQIGNEASQNYYSVHPESDLHSTTTMTNITF